MEDAIGDRLPKFSGAWLNRAEESVRTWYYRLAMERGYLDSYLKNYIVYPFLGILRRCDALEQTWTKMLAGKESSKAPTSEASPTLEELL